MTTLNLGFIGLGIMGAPMAAYQRAARHTLYVHSRSAPPQALTDAGAITCASGTEIAQKNDLNLALQSARTLRVALPQTAGAAQLRTHAALGHGQLDHSVTVCALEALANRDVE